jgi:hypothetical protein
MGTQKAVLSPGFHTRFFGEAIPFKKYLTVSVGSSGEVVSGSVGLQEIRFCDSVAAQVRKTSRFELPSTEERFLKMAIAYGAQDNLIHSP